MIILEEIVQQETSFLCVKSYSSRIIIRCLSFYNVECMFVMYTVLCLNIILCILVLKPFSLFVCNAMFCKPKSKALKTFKMENLENVALQVEECIRFWNGIACFYFCWIRKAFVILNKLKWLLIFLYFVDIIKRWMCLAFSPCLVLIIHRFLSNEMFSRMRLSLHLTPPATN